MCEAADFELYRDAVAFFNNIDTGKYPAGTVDKVIFDGTKGFEKAVSSEVKLARFEPGTCNTAMLMSFNQL